MTDVEFLIASLHAKCNDFTEPDCYGRCGLCETDIFLRYLGKEPRVPIPYLESILEKIRVEK